MAIGNDAGGLTAAEQDSERGCPIFGRGCIDKAVVGMEPQDKCDFAVLVSVNCCCTSGGVGRADEMCGAVGVYGQVVVGKKGNILDDFAVAATN